MNDNSKRSQQWQKLIGEFFIPRFGGTPEQWAAANRGIVEKLMQKIDEMYKSGQDAILDDYYDWENTYWIDTMFTYMNIEAPSNKIELSIEASKWITPRVNSSYPGIISTIHQLSEDYELYTASNEVSYELEGYLTGMGVVDHFQEFFGADLLGAMKTSTLYYQRLIEKTGINPDYAVVVDDSLKNLQFASEVGFKVIHSGLSGTEPQSYPYFNDPADLPGLIKEL